MIIFSSAAIFATPLSQKRKTLEQVDALIEQKKINDALVLLQQYMDENPDDFDQAQKRINKILKIRQNYADIAKELFRVLEYEPENNEKQLNIIAELENMEKNPNEATKKFIKQAKSAAQFTYYRTLYNKIMAEGSKQKEQKKYQESINTFYSGMYLYQNEFFESEYEQSVTQKIQKEINDLSSLVTLSIAQLHDVQDSFNELQTVLKENPDRVNGAFKDFENKFQKFSETRNKIFLIGRDFSSTYDMLKKVDTELTDASFLPFAFRLILGDEKIKNSGILASLDQQWDDTITKLIPTFENNVTENLSTVLATMNKKDEFKNSTMSKNKSELESAEKNIAFAGRLNALYSTKKISETKNDDLHSDYSSVELSSATKLVEIIKKQEENLVQMDDLSIQVDKLNQDAKNLGFRIMDLTQKYNSVLVANSTYEESNKKLNDESRIWKKNFHEFSLVTKKITTEVNAKLIQLYLIMADIYEKQTLSILASYEKGAADAASLLNQEKKENDDGNAYSYPAESLEIIKKQIVSYNADIEKINSYQHELSQISSSVKKLQEKKYSDYIKKLDENSKKISQINQKNIELQQYALNQIQLSKRAQNEAELRLSQAKDNLKANNFNQARENLQKARNKFNESLEHQESKQLREKSDKQIEEIALEINRKQNEIVVVEVRKLKTLAKDAYNQGNFELAENYLTQAQNRWAITNIESDEEIVDLFALINTALSIKTGRTILPTNPLYPEMSSLLSFANQFYDEGVILIGQGKREDAEKILNEAEKKLAQVRVSFPLNQDSRILSLKIKKLLDEKTFEQQFKTDFEKAKAKFIKDKNKRQEAYIELTDLYSISPDYPGLRDEIYKMEIAMGMRLPPPDQKAIARSKTLTKEAQLLYNTSRDEISMNTALAKVNEAIKLDSNNENAKLLKDSIQTRIGGKASVVLSAESERMYQQAIQELQQGNIIASSALVSQLLQKKENKNSAKILELKRKVDSFL